MVAQGRLERMYIVSPSLFGGSEANDNVLYVPLGTSARKDELDAQLVQWAEEGHKIGFNCNPEYKDKSVVPSKITIICKCDGRHREHEYDRAEDAEQHAGSFGEFHTVVIPPQLVHSFRRSQNRTPV